ncbi:MAG: polymer-forming cytoskeletal protein [Cytophagales bacterium]
MFTGKEEKKIIEQTTNISNIIGKGTVIEGKITTQGNLRIEGKFVGNLETQSKLVTSESSELEGEIKAQNAEVAGKIKGAIYVDDMLVLKSSSFIDGDIYTSKLTVEPGARFNGVCKMEKSLNEKKPNVNSKPKPELIA